ncbi:MAG: hypothetical protein ACRBM6_25230 [Geminicoccales bacterium]
MTLALMLEQTTSRTFDIRHIGCINKRLPSHIETGNDVPLGLAGHDADVFDQEKTGHSISAEIL